MDESKFATSETENTDIEKILKQKDNIIQNLKQELHYLRSIISMMPGNVYWKDTQHVYLGCNNNVAKMLKLESPQDFIGKKMEDIVTTEVADAVTKIDQEVMTSGIPIVIEENGLDSNFKPAIYHTQKAPLRDKLGNIIGLLGVSFDITKQKNTESELKKAKEKELYYLRDIIGKMPGNVYWKDRNGIYLGCNNNAVRLLKLASHQEIIGKKAEDFLELKYAQMVNENDNKIMLDGVSSIIEENAFDPDGNPAIYFTQKVPLRDEAGNVTGLLGISLNITQQKENEEALKKAKEEAENAYKVKSEFIMNMSHDLRTPFSGILGFARILEKKETDSEKKLMISYVVQSSEKLLDLLNDILNLSRTEGEKTTTESQIFDIQHLCQQVTSLMLAEIKRKKLKLYINIDSEIPNQVFGDKLKLHRILLNLLNNAVKFTEQGHVAIKIQLLSRVEEQIILNFQIEDSGIGIPNDKFGMIFEQFSRLNSSYQGNYNGAGLGLSIVKQFVHDLDGKMEVRSDLGKGSSFNFIIPLQIATNTSHSQAQLKLNKLTNSKRNFNRILLVEDDAIAQKLAEVMLKEEFNCQIDFARNSEQALKLSANHDYDLIIMDIGLPDLDGFTTTKMIRTQRHYNETIIIVGLSAHVDDADQKLASNCKMDDIFTKPLSKDFFFKLQSIVMLS